MFVHEGEEFFEVFEVEASDFVKRPVDGGVRVGAEVACESAKENDDDEHADTCGAGVGEVGISADDEFAVVFVRADFHVNEACGVVVVNLAGGEGVGGELVAVNEGGFGELVGGWAKAFVGVEELL